MIGRRFLQTDMIQMIRSCMCDTVESGEWAKIVIHQSLRSLRLLSALIEFLRIEGKSMEHAFPQRPID